ncbi:MAG: PKD domain-containing protein [Candidatus Bipolaricaulota bacterium]
MLRRIVPMGIGILILVSGWSASALAAWSADFTPSTYNPAVGDAVSFAVCEPCLGGGAFRYEWDFDSDGTVDIDTDAVLVSCTFAAQGFYEVTLTVRDSGGRTQVAKKGVLVGAVPAYGVRQVVDQGDGTLFVVVQITVTGDCSALGFVEAIPQGWQVEVLDAAGAMTNLNSEEKRLEALWGSQFAVGDEITFSYRLHPGYATASPRLSGEVSGYVTGLRFVGATCGSLSAP